VRHFSASAVVEEEGEKDDRPVDTDPDDDTDRNSNDGEDDESGKDESMIEDGDGQSQGMWDPRRNQTPVWELHHYYRQTHAISQSLEALEIDAVPVTSPESGERAGWTATFTCPVSGVVYPAGVRRDLEQFVVEDPEGLSRVLYKKKKHAVHAAAARALDAIQYQTMGLQEPRFCVEDPSEEAAVQPQLLGALEDGQQEERQMVTEEAVDAPVRSPLWELNDYYEQQHGISKSDLTIDATPVASPETETPLWTATFRCPVTKVEYPAGTMKNAVHAIAEDEEDTSRILYTKKGLAVQASAARTLDAIRYQATGLTEPRFCEEDPSLPLIVVPLNDGSHTGLLEKNIKASLSSSLRIEPLPPATPRELDVCNEKDEDEEEEEIIPTFLTESSLAPPSQRILESFAAHRRRLEIDERPLSTRDRVKEIELVLNTARKWLKIQSLSHTALEARERRSVVDLTHADAPHTLLMGKLVLDALADVNQSYPGSFPIIEQLAEKVVEALWETRNAKPDTDLYNNYLKCLHGPSRRKDLQKAESVVEAMSKQKKWVDSENVLPRPNQTTINILIQKSARVGGKKGRHPKFTTGDFKPDRESFLSVLSSCWFTGLGGGFSRAFVNQCIQRMEELVAETGDESLLPDTAVYNAPLRWSSDPSLFKKSRPYARRIHWHNYSRLFEHGLDHHENLSLHRAEEIEKWMNHMKDISASNPSVAPNLETFEAVIQTWLQTSTREGLDRAETIARQLLEGDESMPPPRLQTLYPILVAWFHIRDPQAPSKVDEWIKLIEPLVAGESAFYPVRVELSLASELSRQNAALLQLNDEAEDNQVAIDNVLTAAKNCSRILEQAVTQVQNDDELFFDVHWFALCVEAWRKVAVSSEGLEKRAVSEMIRTVMIFDRIVQIVTQSENPNGRRDKEISVLLRYMTASAYSLNWTFIEELDKLEISEKKRYPLVRSLPLLERMVRRLGEFVEIETSGMSLGLDYEESSGFDARRFSELLRIHGPSLRDDEVPPRVAFFGKVVGCLGHGSLGPVESGDVVRLCCLLKDVLPILKSDTSELIASVDRILARSLPGTSHVRPQSRPGEPRNSLGFVKRTNGKVKPIQISNGLQHRETSNGSRTRHSSRSRRRSKEA
jgi:hypothetical protein